MATKNPWEAEARRQKVAKLVCHITELVGFLGIDAKVDGYLIADLVRNWGDPEWQQAAINIGKDHVGVDSRLAVINHFVNSARKAS